MRKPRHVVLTLAFGTSVAALAACAPSDGSNAVAQGNQAEVQQATAPNGRHYLSQPLVRSMYFADPSAHVFNGKIYVEKEAQKTDAFQQNNNVLLSDRATVNAKPQLEIFADDVKCSHGCTVGQLDEKAMFYMQSRGIPKKEAKALLMYAFSNEVIESIKIPELKNRINKLIAMKLGVNMGFDL